MKVKLALSIAAIAAFGFANAQYSFTNVNATYSVDNVGPINWITNANSTMGTIDFSQNAPAFKVGDSTGYSVGFSRITFDVTSSVAIDGIDLIMQGTVIDWGRVQFGENVHVGGTTIGSISGSILGGNYTGGANGGFSNVYHIDFNQAVTEFSVTKEFDLDINGEPLPSTSIAGLSLVEQNLTPVPEPASLAALGAGALALLRRRSRK